MKDNINKKKYTFLAKIMHWGFVLLTIYGVAKQIEDINQLQDKSLFQFEMIFALIFVFLLLIRFIYMKKTQETSLPDDTPKGQKLAAKIVHLWMYCSLAGVALTGLLIGSLFWLGFKEGFLIELVTEIHGFIVNMLYLLIGTHILAATYHRLKKDGVWSSMVPFLKEK